MKKCETLEEIAYNDKVDSEFRKTYLKSEISRIRKEMWYEFKFSAAAMPFCLAGLGFGTYEAVTHYEPIKWLYGLFAGVSGILGVNSGLNILSGISKRSDELEELKNVDLEDLTDQYSLINNRISSKASFIEWTYGQEIKVAESLDDVEKDYREDLLFLEKVKVKDHLWLGDYEERDGEIFSWGSFSLEMNGKTKRFRYDTKKCPLSFKKLLAQENKEISLLLGKPEEHEKFDNGCFNVITIYLHENGHVRKADL